MVSTRVESHAPARTRTNPSPRAIKALIHFGFVVSGAATVILGPVLPLLISRWSMTDERAGMLFTLEFTGNLIGVACLGKLISSKGYGWNFGIGFGLIAAGISALGFGTEVVGFCGTVLFGFGLGLILPGTNLWVAESEPEGRAGALSLLNLAWGIGAIACPPFVLLAAKIGHPGLIFVVVAALAVLQAALVLLLDVEPKGVSTTEPGEESGGTIGFGIAAILCALFFLYCGAESALGGWTAALVKRMSNARDDWWELAPMCFWAGLLFGRAIGPIVLRRFAERSILMVGLAVGAVCSGALTVANSFTAVSCSLVLAGVGLACIFPLLVSSLVAHFGESRGRIRSFVFASAGVGGATIPWLVGFASTHTGSLRTGLLVPLLSFLSTLGLAIVLRRISPIHSRMDEAGFERPMQTSRV